MIKILNYHNGKNGQKKIEFFQLGIYDLLKLNLGFRYTKINNKGHYLRESNGVYEIVGFHKLKYEFVKFIDENYEKLEFSKEISYHDFMNAFYEKSPIRNGNYAREYLGEDFQLSESNLHLILFKNDSNYSRKYRREEVVRFLQSEDFIETIDVVGNFAKNCPLFYKRVQENKFLLFNNPFYDNKNNSPTFDFWKIIANSEKTFLNNRASNLTQLKLEFDLKQDIGLFEEEKNAL